jgi:prolyl oligopeptidase
MNICVERRHAFFRTPSSNRLLMMIFTVALLALGVSRTSARETNPTCPPPTRIDNDSDTYGSTVVPDPYRWLEDQNSKETRAWIEAHNTCTESILSKLPGRAPLTERLTALYRVDTYKPPLVRAGRYFFTKQLASQDLRLIYMRRGTNGVDDLLVDPLPWSADHSVSATIEQVSKDGKYLYYGRRDGGQDEVTIHVLDVDTHIDLPDVLPSADYSSIEATPDRSGIYYAKATPEGPRAYYHAMGTDPTQDKLLYGEKLAKDKILVVTLSDSGANLAYLLLYGSGSERTEIYLQNLRQNGPIVPAVNDVNSRFYPSWGGDTLYVLTNWKAPLWHVYAASPANPGRDSWKEVIPEADINLDDLKPAGGKLIASYLRNASSEIKIFDGDGKSSSLLSLPGLGTASVSGEWESKELFDEFESFNYPAVILDHNLATSQTTVWAKSNAPVRPEDFEVHQVWYNSKDKTRVPMFLFYKKGLKLDGSNPVFLTAYGGFGVSETPSFRPERLLWAESGGVVAVANIRGGGELGENWHRDGMLNKKQNVFDDFVAAGEYLIANKYTSPPKLSIVGGSNGGLLVGAALTQRPDLIRAVVCLYPLEDMLRFQKFMEGPYWVAEYGSSDDTAQFPVLYAYSPYHHVKPGTSYPAVLFITGDGDTRVAPLHARKMAARLQADTTSGLPILLLYDTKSGHSGGRPLNKEIEENTDLLSFLIWQLHMLAK